MKIFTRRRLGRAAGLATRRGTSWSGSLWRVSMSVVGALAMLPATVAAQGDVPAAPSLATLWEGWSFEPDVVIPILVAGWAYWQARRMVDRVHPDNPVPRWRAWSWFAGLGALVLALGSPVERFDTTLFSVHMVQHLLLTMVAAPLLVFAAPITLLLRVSAPEFRRRWILPVLHSRVVSVLSHPLVAWCGFAAVMWFSHFSPLFDASLQDVTLHRLEHALYLGTALLFWWPVIGADPSPHRLSFPVRVFYLALGMPLSSFLGLVIYSAQTPLYPSYLALRRDWGPTPMEDQALAGGIMWAGGDLVFVIALIAVVAAWLRHEERENHREDARLARAAAHEARPARAAVES